MNPALSCVRSIRSACQLAVVIRLVSPCNSQKSFPTISPSSPPLLLWDLWINIVEPCRASARPACNSEAAIDPFGHLLHGGAVRGSVRRAFEWLQRRKNRPLIEEPSQPFPVNPSHREGFLTAPGAGEGVPFRTLAELLGRSASPHLRPDGLPSRPVRMLRAAGG